jgi:DNA-binding transcriptional ArsR family regulator
MFVYTVFMDTAPIHPATEWEQDARRPYPQKISLRLAAMAGHMKLDKLAARRAALVDLLADGRPHPREEIWAAIAAQLGEDCWGKVPQEALARDLSALRKGGIRIAYSRRPKIQGYYLQYPSLKRPSPRQYEAVNWDLIEAIRHLPVPEKNKRAFAAADFALRQKRLILTEEHPDWSAAEVEEDARRILFGRRSFLT